MIVVDTSALIEIAIGAPRAHDCRHTLKEADSLLISAGTVTETLIVAARRDAEPQMTALLDRFGMNVVPLTEERAKAAARAYLRFGKGRHEASLNFGDSFAYALAKEYDCPLLFVGNDFALTDVISALASSCSAPDGRYSALAPSPLPGRRRISPYSRRLRHSPASPPSRLHGAVVAKAKHREPPLRADACQPQDTNEEAT